MHISKNFEENKLKIDIRRTTVVDFLLSFLPLGILFLHWAIVNKHEKVKRKKNDWLFRKLYLPQFLLLSPRFLFRFRMRLRTDWEWTRMPRKMICRSDGEDSERPFECTQTDATTSGLALQIQQLLRNNVIFPTCGLYSVNCTFFSLI